MAAPEWVLRILAIAMIAVTIYHLSRLAVVRRVGAQTCQVQVDVEATHAAMGCAMALMVTGYLAPAELRGLGLVFIAPLLWFALRAVGSYLVNGSRGGDVATRQVVGCAAMAYMLLASAAASAGLAASGNSTVRSVVVGTLPSGMSMSGSGALTSGALSWPVLRIVVIGSVLGLCGWSIMRMRKRSPEDGHPFGVGCQLAVNATTIYMLVAM